MKAVAAPIRVFRILRACLDELLETRPPEDEQTLYGAAPGTSGGPYGPGLKQARTATRRLDDAASEI